MRRWGLDRTAKARAATWENWPESHTHLPLHSSSMLLMLHHTRGNADAVFLFPSRMSSRYRLPTYCSITYWPSMSVEDCLPNTAVGILERAPSAPIPVGPRLSDSAVGVVDRQPSSGAPVMLPHVAIWPRHGASAASPGGARRRGAPTFMPKQRMFWTLRPILALFGSVWRMLNWLRLSKQ